MKKCQGESLIQTSRYASAVSGGDYSRVADEALAAGLSAVTALDLPWVIASLCWIGRSTEAEGIFVARQTELSGEALIAARFFVAVAQCREGKHDKARISFVKNLVDARGSLGLSAFFAMQGMAFYRFATGRLAKARLWAEKALMAAAGADFTFGRVLAGELLGHVELSRGQTRAGFRHLKLAVQGAEKLGQGALLQMMKTSETLYRSTYGQALNADAQAAELQAAATKSAFDDTYTKASLLIELTRIRLLQGRLADAQQLLESASDLVYRIDNPDLELEHNLCLVGLMRRRGELFQALTLTRSCYHRAKARRDLRLILKVLGAEMAVLGDLGRIDEQRALASKIEPMTRSHDSLIARRILARVSGEKRSLARPGEDPLGDLIDAAGEGWDAVPKILSKGWLGLLPGALGLAPTDDVLYFDLEPGSLTLFEHGEVLHLATGCTDLTRKLLTALGAGEATKESLTASLWGHAYHPLRHDTLIYGLVAKTRKLLGQAATWIESIESGYRLRPGVRVAVRRTQPATADREPQAVAPLAPDLNYRQNLIFGWLGAGEVLEAKTIMDRLGISDATASRDLTGLVERGFAARLGRGKATRYRAAQPSS